MKSTTNENNVKVMPELPYLMIHPEHGIIVLATAIREDGVVTGTCVHSPPNIYGIQRMGEHCTAWCRTFKYYDGSVTLEN